MSGIIEPKILKGFRDSLPEVEGTRLEIIKKLEEVFLLFGFVPIDTPVLEYSEVLLGKGGGETDKQVYRFHDAGNRDVAMRFDLTVPFARFMAAHVHDLYLPFKRYHIAKVWRGENTQRGRYREFVQCDFDIVGVDSSSADFEILLCIYRAFLTLLGTNHVHIRFNHRGIFNRFLEKEGCLGVSVEILKNVDKIPKIGKEKVFSILIELVGESSAEAIVEFVTPEDNFHGTLNKMTNSAGGPKDDTERLHSIWKYMEACGISEYFSLDPSITRGLDYYTGTVFETFLTDLPDIGSVCSGGRYNNLASLYTKQKLPGVGTSIGLDRLVSALEDITSLPERSGGTDCIVFCLDQDYYADYHRISEILRDRGISCEVFPENKKLGQQFNYAEKKHIPFAVFFGEDEKRNGSITLKDLRIRKNYDCSTTDDLIRIIQSDTL